jgi:hypothetical protein
VDLAEHERSLHMALPIRIGATVSPDGKIELALPELHPGERVSITIEPEQPEIPPLAPNGGISMIDLIKDLPGHRLFKTAEEVDDYLRQERDSWER